MNVTFISLKVLQETLEFVNFPGYRGTPVILYLVTPLKQKSIQLSRFKHTSYCFEGHLDIDDVKSYFASLKKREKNPLTVNTILKIYNIL